ncbi:MAG: hypothetical protein ABI321_15485 [Polyangia bacterium]
MNVGFLGAELSRWDALLREGVRPSVLGLPFFDDERPLRGAAGLCDWRLGGRISRLLGARIGPQRDDRGEAVKLRGVFGEKLLLPTGPRLPFSRLVLFGLGPQRSFDESVARKAVSELLGTLRQLVDAPAGATAAPEAGPVIGIVPPGRSTGALSARRALELLLEGAEQQFGQNHENQAPPVRLVVVESQAAQKEAGELIRRFSSDLGSPSLI